MNEREIIELADACGRRACNTEHHHGCPYGDKGLMDCVERLEQDYEASVKRLLALLDAVHGDCKYCAHNGPENAMEGPCAECVHFAAKDLAKGDFWTLADMSKEETRSDAAYICIDQDHNTWQCTACGHMETFEADGPTENGWGVCPHCARRIVAEELTGCRYVIGDEISRPTEEQYRWLWERFNRGR